MKTLPDEKCPDCYYWAELDIGLGYCQYTYRTQQFMTGKNIQSMQAAIIQDNNEICDQWEEAGTDLFSANTDPYDKAS